jgi:hypothetical protein
MLFLIRHTEGVLGAAPAHSVQWEPRHRGRGSRTRVGFTNVGRVVSCADVAVPGPVPGRPGQPRCPADRWPHSDHRV